MTRTRTIALTLIVVAAIAVGGYLAYDQVLRGDDVASLALPSSEPSADPGAAAPTLAPAASSPATTSS